MMSHVTESSFKLPGKRASAEWWKPHKLLGAPALCACSPAFGGKFLGMLCQTVELATKNMQIGEFWIIHARSNRHRGIQDARNADPLPSSVIGCSMSHANACTRLGGEARFSAMPKVNPT